MRRLIVVFVTMVFVAGCANTLDHQQALMAQMAQQMQEENSKNQKLCDMKYTEVSASAPNIRNKLIFDITAGAPADMLANATFATDQEKQELLLFGEAREYCTRLGHALLQKFFNPEYMTVAVNIMNTGKNDFLDLYEGRITYGEYNKRRSSLKSYQDGKFYELDAKYREIARQEQLHAQQLQMQRSAILLNYSARMLQPTPTYTPYIRPPVHTTCQNLGGFINCTQW